MKSRFVCKFYSVCVCVCVCVCVFVLVAQSCLINACDCPLRPGRLVGTVSMFSLCSAPGHWCLRGRSLCTRLVPWLLWLQFRGWSPDSPHLVASRTCGHGSHGTIGNREFLTGYTPKAHCRAGRQKRPAPSLSFKATA